MKTTAKIFGTLSILSLFILTGCKKEGPAGAAGPAGATGPQGPVINMTSNGVIAGTITGKRKDGVNFSETFNYTYYFPGTGSSGTLDSLGTSNYSFYMQRSTSDVFSNDQASVQIGTAAKTSTMGNLSMTLAYEKSLGGNKFFYFSNNSAMTATTAVTYNTSAGTLAGNFSFTVSGTNNSTTNTATITGNYSADIMQRVNKLANPNVGTKVH